MSPTTPVQQSLSAGHCPVHFSFLPIMEDDDGSTTVVSRRTRIQHQNTRKREEEHIRRNKTFPFLKLPRGTSRSTHNMLLFLTKSQKFATMFTVIFSSAPPESYLPQITSNVDSDPAKSIPRILEEHGYQWDYQRQTGYNIETGLPTRDWKPDEVRVVWATMPTHDEHENIQRALKDPRSPYASFGGVKSFITKRHNGRIEIINEEDLQSPGLTGLKFLRSCSQVAREGPEILYGENKCVFNTAEVHSKYSLSENATPHPRNPERRGPSPLNSTNYVIGQ
jgi:hypothetical protein